MTGRNTATRVLIVIAIITTSEAAISDRRLCYNSKCSAAVSEGITLTTYYSNDPGILSFKSNVDVTVFSKSAGNRKDLWGVEIKGQRGYIPHQFIKEKVVWRKTLKHEVPTEQVIHTPETIPAKKEPVQIEDVQSPPIPQPSQVSPSFEVHDGTTIPVAENEIPLEPSYSTATLASGPQGAEHPVLSVYPSMPQVATSDNIESSKVGSSENIGDKESAEESHEKILDSVPTVNEMKPEEKASVEELNDKSEETILNGSLPKTDKENIDEVTNKSSDVSTPDTPVMDAETRTGNTEEHVDQNVPESTVVEHGLENIHQQPDNVGDEKKEQPEHHSGLITPEETEQRHAEPTRPEMPGQPVEKPREEPTIMEIPEQQAEQGRIEPEQPREEPTIVEIPEQQAEQVRIEPEQPREEPKKTITPEEPRNEQTTPITLEYPREGPTMPITPEDSREEPTIPTTPEHPREEPTTAEPTEHLAPPTTPETAEYHAPAITPEIQDQPQKEPAKLETLELTPDEPKAADRPPEHLDEKRFSMEEVENKAPVIEPESEPCIPMHIGNLPEINEMRIDERSIATQEQSAENGIDASDKGTLDNSRNAVVGDETLKYDSRESENAVENTFPEPRENVEETSGTKSSEVGLDSANVLNPLFNRQSVLTTMGREERAVSDQDAGEPEIAKSYETLDIHEPETQTNIRVDTDKTGADISIRNETASRTIEPESIELSRAEKNLYNVDNSLVDVGIGEKKNDTTADNIATSRDVPIDDSVQPGIYKEDELSGFRQDIIAAEETTRFNGFPANRNLLNVGSGLQPDPHVSGGDSLRHDEIENVHESKDESRKPEDYNEPLKKVDEAETVTSPNDDPSSVQGTITETADCMIDSTCQKSEGLEENHSFVPEVEDDTVEEEIDILDFISMKRNYWETFTYLVVTACTTLLFSLGYYYIENARRDGHYIAKINQLEKQLLVCSKECTVLDDTLKSTKTKLDSIEDESFGSNEMVASLKADLEASKTAKAELEDQVAMLEKELESATEAGLELERMLREILSTNNEDNPLAKSVEDLQTRLNAQQAANEALTNALNLKAQENENLAAELKTTCLKTEQLEVEVSRLNQELEQQHNLKSNLEQTLMEKVENLEKQTKDITAERINLRKQLKGKEMELKDLLEVVNQMNTNNLDFEKLYNVSNVKAEASQLQEERDELKIRLSEVEGAHQLLEEHVKLINEEVSSLSEQARLAEKAKRDAETRLEVLSNFFKEKEAQRQKEEAAWLEKQGEVSSTVERLHAMQNEIHNYKQQIEMLKREILDQEREYKNQMSALETKSHENWVAARQNERRLEESKVEASQLRNRLTLIEKNINEADPDVKLHRLEANGETPTSPQLFIGAEASSSPIMFAGASGVPLPPPPSYLYGPHPVPPFMPPPPPPHSSSVITSSYEVGQRPPPLGGRLSSPPPLPVNPSRYDDHRSPPPILQPFGPPHRGFPAFPNERTHPPPPHSIPPPLASGSSHTWSDEALPPPPPPSSLRNTGFHSQHHQQLHRPPQQHHHHHQQQHRDSERRARNHKGSLHSSGESLDKNL